MVQPLPVCRFPREPLLLHRSGSALSMTLLSCRTPSQRLARLLNLALTIRQTLLQRRSLLLLRTSGRLRSSLSLPLELGCALRRAARRLQIPLKPPQALLQRPTLSLRRVTIRSRRIARSLLRL